MSTASRTRTVRRARRAHGRCVCGRFIPPVAFRGEPWRCSRCVQCAYVFALFLQLDEWVLCRLYNKKNNWEKVKAEEPEAAAPFRHQQGAAEDSMSDSFQTHDSDIDNNAFGMQNGFGNMVHGQTMTMRNGIGSVTRTVKEDNYWFTDLNLDDLQAPYNVTHVLNPNPVQTMNLAAGQGHGYLQSMSSPSTKMWQTILPPF